MFGSVKEYIETCGLYYEILHYLYIKKPDTLMFILNIIVVGREIIYKQQWVAKQDRSNNQATI